MSKVWLSYQENEEAPREQRRRQKLENKYYLACERNDVYAELFYKDQIEKLSTETSRMKKLPTLSTAWT